MALPLTMRWISSSLSPANSLAATCLVSGQVESLWG